jgi:HAD superfamily hydrolase (TIGR01509 family)
LHSAGRRKIPKLERFQAKWTPVRVKKTRQNKKAPVPLDLVIFDCDGVLVDSEVISCRAHADLLTRHGYPITAEQVFERFLGRSTRQANVEVEAELGRSLSGDFHVELRDELFRSFTATLQAIPHIHQALDAITQPVCVASSGSQDRMRVSLGRARLYDRFAPHIFSASQVRNGKPAPDLFLFAARQMATSPERCLVIEDSVPGITGACAAGMTVLGFVGGSHCRPGYADTLRAAGAVLTFDDMGQLPDLIERIGVAAVPG